MTRILFACCFGLLAACAANPASDPAGGSGGMPITDPDGTCVPNTCEGLGLSCGAANDGCGNQLDCGMCQTSNGGGTCVPRSCDGHCGPIDDGCGHQKDCGGCGTGFACMQEGCVATNCAQFGADPNACGSCGPLVIDPNAACPCGGVVASCNVYGQSRCEATHTIKLPDTNDSEDAWRNANGTISVVPGGEADNYEAPIDYWNVWADDTIWGMMQPELQFHGPSNVRLKVCFYGSAGNYDVSSPVDCGEGFELNGGGCCKIKEVGQTDLSFALRINFGLPTPTNDDVAATVEVTTYQQAEPIAACAAYSFSYRF
jgi:hypothetical protein